MKTTKKCADCGDLYATSITKGAPTKDLFEVEYASQTYTTHKSIAEARASACGHEGAKLSVLGSLAKLKPDEGFTRCKLTMSSESFKLSEVLELTFANCDIVYAARTKKTVTVVYLK